jgi:hypothetical protein
MKFGYLRGMGEKRMGKIGEKKWNSNGERVTFL